MNKQLANDVVVLASANKGKLRELQELMGRTVNVVLAPDLRVEMPEETAQTFSGNAAIKAKAVYEQTGHVSVADDSGLEVDALDGKPGVYSARYAGENASDNENNEKLLKELENVPEGLRTARFRCAIAIALDEGEPLVFEGSIEGSVGFEAAGTNGFGYDPLFRLPNGNSFGELTSEEKNPISHRGVAMRKAIPVLLDHLRQKEDQS